MKCLVLDSYGCYGFIGSIVSSHEVIRVRVKKWDVIIKWNWTLEQCEVGWDDRESSDSPA